MGWQQSVYGTNIPSWSVTALGYFALTPYRPPIAQYTLTAVAVIILSMENTSGNR